MKFLTHIAVAATIIAVGLSLGSQQSKDQLEDGSEFNQSLFANARTYLQAASLRSDLDMDDHYGNPDAFIQYIIRIPPVHA